MSPFGHGDEVSMRCLKLILSTAISTSAVIGIGSALAADLAERPYSKAAVAVVNPVYNWTGFYIGAHGGGDWFRKDWYLPVSAVNGAAVCGGTPGICNQGAGGHSGSSWLAGGQVGFNYQVASWVLGVEGQGSFAGLNGQNLDPIPSVAAAGINNFSRTDGLGTIAARLGYAVDRALFFAKGGGAWAHDQFRVGLVGAPAVQGLTDNRFGWMVGGGIEYALANNWSIKMEYDHLDLGRKRETLQPLSPTATSADYDISQRVDLIMVGINYKFGSADPVVARY